MWFWLRNNTHKVTWIHLAALSSISHLLLLAWFFFILKENGSKLSLVVTADLFKNDIQFVVASRHKPKSGGKAAAQSHSKAKKTAPKKQPPKTTMQKDVPKKNVPKKPVTSAQAKPEVKKEVAPAPPKKEPAVHEPIKKTVEPAQKVPEDPQKYELATNAVGAYERGLLEEFKALHQEIVECWAPPRGVALESSCQITVHVDWQGEVREMLIDKSSGVLIYDASARKVLHEIKMPRWTWGKELTITFNQ